MEIYPRMLPMVGGGEGGGFYERLVGLVKRHFRHFKEHFHHLKN